MRDFSPHYYIFMRDFLPHHYIFMRDFSHLGAVKATDAKKRLHVPKAPCNRFVILLITIV